MIQTHECAAEGCKEPCPPSHLMCVRHWRMVPMAIRREIFSAYRRFRRVKTTEAEKYLAAGRALQEKQDAAIAAVRDKQLAKTQRIEEIQQPFGFEP